eukprot:CAMPEP_0181297502 /NCGR_PEP_ID=MMETSP1101-20121128/5274_1 /TAXON_ID=46948 /ORGANISM="Rhodomonas abbreviata, Strain Caron Lab Isolate" /LENGTH=199 /DNA_ID=CAMNT_0023402443 /DNA_START=231 /DNA_END=830 /DNA_ORIENTATION=-
MSNDFFPACNAKWAELGPAGGDISATGYVAAVDAFLPMFDRMGSVFFPVKSDVGGNVKKLKDALAAAPADSLQALLRNEKAAGKHKNKEAAAIALLWLKRALQFTFLLLEKVCGGMDANKAAKEAYEETLMAFHGFMVKKTFQMGLMAAPSTATLLKALGDDPKTVMDDMKKFVEYSGPQMAVIDAFLVSEGLDDKSKA